ncbi:MAG: alpha-glucosidase C-terminal domain-containing protein [Lachnospiraceae bacterium]|nr:alpha-glucosidase C-terminal domain-containing protein [Lachnospiraceae bacterium]
MAWYDEAIFYHIYPLGLLGAPKENKYDGITHRLPKLNPWIEHIKNIGCNAIYIGPLFESEGHGYETTDYRKLDSRLGDNNDLKKFVKQCHKAGIKVIFDGVFNHTGRNFFAFRDLKEHREGSRYRDWYCNVNFFGNNEYNDGFSYDNWGGYNLLVKLNQRNPEVRDYICDVIRFWVKEFDVDGIRLDAADVLDFDFMKALRATANEVKPEFWLMGEVIHGDYSRWVNEGTLHSVTNYNLHKALYSGHNDHNYFEIAHTVKRLYDMGGSRPDGLKLYNFTDNHDVERIYTRLNNKAHITPVNILLYTLPGIPSIYYGSEFGIEGRKENHSDDSLRPALDLDNFRDAITSNPVTSLIARLGMVRQMTPALSYGDYKELILTNRQYAFSRKSDSGYCVVAVNNDDNPYSMSLPAQGGDSYTGLLSGKEVPVQGGQINVTLEGNSGDIWVPTGSVDMGGSVKTGKKTKSKTIEPAPCPDPVSTNEVNIDSWVEVEGPVKATNVDDSWAELPTENSNRDSIASAADSGVSGCDSFDSVGKNVPEENNEDKRTVPVSQSYEDGIIRGLQEAVLARMEKNGPITDQMRRDVEENVYHDGNARRSHRSNNNYRSGTVFHRRQHQGPQG